MNAMLLPWMMLMFLACCVRPMSLKPPKIRYSMTYNVGNGSRDVENPDGNSRARLIADQVLDESMIRRTLDRHTLVSVGNLLKVSAAKESLRNPTMVCAYLDIMNPVVGSYSINSII